MTESPEFRPVTDEQKERARLAIEQLERDLAASAGRPKPPVYSPGKFTDPLGLDAHGNLQPPLTATELAEKEERRRRAGRATAASGSLFGLAYGDALAWPADCPGRTPP